ncbi:MAG: hypothetical protein ABSB19_17565 [Methylomonas sp.]|jgi:hypothetical protein
MNTSNKTVSNEHHNLRSQELDIANYEDINYLSSLWSKTDLNNADIRRSATIMRRLLYYKEIQRSASPRSLRLMFNSPDNKAFVRHIDNGHIHFFQSGGTLMFGFYFRAGHVKQDSKDLQEALANFDPDKVIQLKLDLFLNQTVFSFKGKHISRKAVLLYVANKAAGTHFDTERLDDFGLLDGIRAAIKYEMLNNIPSISFDFDAIHSVNNSFIPSGKGIDPVFIELAAAIRYFTESDSIKELMTVLKNDLKL